MMSLQVLFDVRHLPAHGKVSASLTELSLGVLEDCVINTVWPDQASTKILKVEVTQWDASKHASVSADTFFVQSVCPLPDNSTLGEGVLSALSDIWTTLSLDALQTQRVDDLESQHSLRSSLLGPKHSGNTKSLSDDAYIRTNGSHQATALQTVNSAARTQSPGLSTGKGGSVQQHLISTGSNTNMSTLPLERIAENDTDGLDMLRTVQSARLGDNLAKNFTAGGSDVVLDTLRTVQSANTSLLHGASIDDVPATALTLHPPAISQLSDKTRSGQTRHLTDQSATLDTQSSTWLTLQTKHLKTQTLWTLPDDVTKSKVHFTQTGTWMTVDTADLQTETFSPDVSTWRIKSQRCGGSMPKLYCIRLYMHDKKGLSSSCRRILSCYEDCFDLLICLICMC
jgi:hypothetical protein